MASDINRTAAMLRMLDCLLQEYFDTPYVKVLAETLKEL